MEKNSNVTVGILKTWVTRSILTLAKWRGVDRFRIFFQCMKLTRSRPVVELGRGS